MKHKLVAVSSQEEKLNQEERRLRVYAWSGIAGLLAISAIAVLCFFTKAHDWAWSDQSTAPSKLTHNLHLRWPRQYLLPNSILNIAEVSEADRDRWRAASIPPSQFSRAALRLHRALQAHADRTTADLFRAANKTSSGTGALTCPFEVIGGEQTLVLGSKENKNPSPAAALDRCAEAVERIAITQEPSDH